MLPSLPKSCSLAVAVIAGFLLRTVIASPPAHADDDAITRLQSRVQALERRAYGDPANLPPLDSPITYLRGQSKDTPPGYTTQILSLVHEVTAKQAFPWPLYIQLTSAHDRGDAVGATVRMTTTGDGWGTGFHAETFHDAGAGTTIGVNIEPHKRVDSGRSIGVNIQAVDWAMQGKAPETTTIDEAINIQSAPKARFRDGIRFDAGSRGGRAIAIDGNWDSGIHLGASPIDFGGDDGVRLTWDPAARRLVVRDRRTGAVVATLARAPRR
ncbi:MAG: hypothetical protein ACKO5K_12845 [Armatimonadota bacterium]